MDLKRIIKKRSKLLKNTYFRSDSSKNFSVFLISKDQRDKKLSQFKHNLSLIMTYLPGIYATPSQEYAEKYPQAKLFCFEFSGKIFKLPKDLNQVKGDLTLGEFHKWLVEHNYDAVFGKDAANTNFGNFDEIVILTKSKIKNIKEMEKNEY